MPAFVGPDTWHWRLAIRNTEETRREEAARRGAQIIVVSSGGKLSQYARQNGQGLIQVPSGFVPRAAVGWLFAPQALLLGELGLIEGVKEEIREVAAVLKELRESLKPTVDIPVNQARVIAGKCRGNIPVIWGTTGVSEVAAQRWKAQINENAKSPAYYSIFPEPNHNEIVGFSPGRFIAETSLYYLKR